MADLVFADLAAVEARVLAHLAAKTLPRDIYGTVAAETGVPRSVVKQRAYMALYSADPATLFKGSLAAPMRRKSKGWRRHLRRLKAASR